MTEAEWLISDQPERMLRFVTGFEDVAELPQGWKMPGERRLRLLACGAYRFLYPRRDSGAIEQVEAQADGGEALYPDWPVSGMEGRLAVTYYLSHSDARGNEEELAGLIRELIGNPFRPVLPGWAWLTDAAVPASMWYVEMLYGCTIPRLAHAAYEKRQAGGTLDSHLLAVLADALEEAGVPVEEVITETVTAHYRCVRCGKQGHRRGGGYPFEDMYRCGSCGWSWEPGETYTVTRHAPSLLLSHLRSSGPHVRGCWALDLVLGKG